MIAQPNPLSRRSLLGLGLAAAGGTLLAGCTGNQPPAGAPVTQPPGTPVPSATPTPFGVAPLTGLPASAAGIATRPALVVDVYLDGSAPAPTGLDGADVVFEEVSGRGSRRLMAVYQSRDVARIGPVADTWPSDIRNLPVLHPLVAGRGGVQKFSNVLGSTSGLIDVSYPGRSTAYTTPPGARSPYNLYTSTAALYRLSPAGAAPPPPVLPLQEAGVGLAGTGVVAAKQVSITVPGEPARIWTLDPATALWHRAGSAIAVNNLAALVMPYRLVRMSLHGPYIRTAEIFGSGAAWLAAGGSAVRCTWSRKGAFGASLVVDASGLPARVRPGTTWVFYVPSGSTVTVS